MEIENEKSKEIEFSKNTFIEVLKKDLTKDYQIIKQIGKGGYGKVYLVSNLIIG